MSLSRRLAPFSPEGIGLFETGGEALSCVEEILPIATRITRIILQLPPQEIFEDVKVVVRTEKPSQKSISYTKARRLCHGLARRHESVTDFQSASQQVGRILAQHYDITPLAQGAGPVLGTPEETAGSRFLERLIDATIAGLEKAPRIDSRLRRICQDFETQIVAGQVEVDWIYPLPAITIPHTVQLSETVRLQELDSKSVERLDAYGEGGLTSQNLLLQTSLALAIRATAKAPRAYTGKENSDILHKFMLAFILSDLPPPLVATGWEEPRKPSVYQLGQAIWFAPWAASPLVIFRDISLTTAHTSRLKLVYRKLDACASEILDSLPVRRLISAAYREIYEDKIIDLWIALEALLLKDNEKNEMQYRMANRAAWILQPDDLTQFRRDLGRAYDDRSKVVHGGRHTLEQKNFQRLQWTFSVLKAIVLYCITANDLIDPLLIDEAMIRGKTFKELKATKLRTE